LFLARSGVGKINDYSLARKQLTQKWGLHYIIAPVEVGDVRKIGDVLVRVGGVILATIERGGHPAYLSGSKVLGTVGLSILNLETIQAGQAKFAASTPDVQAPTYHALSCELESVEIASWVPGTATPYGGMSLSLGTGNQDGVIDALLNVDSEAPIQAFPKLDATAVGRTFP
jgi:hypothetical protein